MTATVTRLTRDLPGARPMAPVRMVHLGLGNFHRAHQAWYTAHAPDAAEWGIAAFTGRRPDAAEALAPQQGLYTLIIRSADGDAFELVGSLSAVHPSSDHTRFLDYLRRPTTAMITLTVTEVGYLISDGRLDRTPAVLADVEALTSDPTTAVTTVPGRLVAGLAARRAAGAGPLTLLSCDNLPHNGAVTRTVVREFAGLIDPDLPGWVDEHVDFASSMVDRITPASTDDDRSLVETEQGYLDASPVPTEPFSEWVLSGAFPAGRPRWDDAGATVVDDVAPFEQRKLWLLNGSHSLLAYAGSVRGHRTIDQAIADPACQGWVEQFWDEAARHLELTGAAVQDYRSALLDRFANPRIAHQLAQIAADGSTKLPVRIIPAMVAERTVGRLPVGCATAVAAWTLHLRGQGAPVTDLRADEARAAAAATGLTDAVRGVLELLRPGLGDDAELVEAVVEQARAISA